MGRNKKALIIGLFILFIVVLNLACNLPLPILNAWIGNQSKDDQEDFKRHVVDTFEATLVSAEEDVVGLTPPDGTSWSCVDVSGELSFFTNPDNLAEGQVLKKAELTLDLYYSGADEGMSGSLRTNLEKDFAVLDGVTNEFIDWDHTKSKKDGSCHRMLLWENGAFGGIMFVTDTREISYPEPGSAKVELQRNVFGLINPLDYKQAYFCDLSRIPGSEDMISLTVENFRERCVLYYYECTAK